MPTWLIRNGGYTWYRCLATYKKMVAFKYAAELIRHKCRNFDV